MPTGLCADSRASLIGRAGLVGLAYLAGAELGHALSLKTHDQTFATLWPPAGLLLAALVQTRPGGWPALLLTACVANLASDVFLHDRAAAVSLGFCAANCGEACLGAWLLRRFLGQPLRLARVRDVLGLACLAAVLSTMAGATIGVGVVTLAFGGSYWPAWGVWWTADAAGVLVQGQRVLIAL